MTADQVPQRTLVIASGNDLLMRSREEAERLKRVMLRAFVKLVPLAGHAVMEEYGTDLLQLLKVLAMQCRFFGVTAATRMKGFIS